MRYSRRLALGITILVGCTALTGGAGLLALTDLNARLAATDDRYDDLRGLYEVGHRAATARLLMNADGQDAEVTRQLLAGLRETGRLQQKPDVNVIAERTAMRESLAAIDAAFQAALVARQDAAASLEVNQVLAGVASLAGEAGRAIVADRQATTQQVAQAKRVLGGLLAATLLAATVLGVWQHRSVMKPLWALRRGMGDVARRADRPMRERGPREFKEVIRQFNRMAGVIHAQEQALRAQVDVRGRQLVHSERLAGIGRLAASAAHEINNPLGIIGGHAETMLRRLHRFEHHEGDECDDQQREMLREVAGSLEVIAQEVGRCHRITTDVLHLGRADEGTETVELGAVVQRAARMLRPLPEWRDRELVVEENAAGPVLVQGSRAALTQVLVNLLTNALEAVEAGTGRVIVSLAVQDGSAILCVRDNGCGMSEEAVRQAFEPFVTGKPRRGTGGVGLGLWVSQVIVQRHGGRMSAASDGPGRGSAFLVELPALCGAGAET